MAGNGYAVQRCSHGCAGRSWLQDAILAGTGVLVTSYRFDSTHKAEKVNLLLASKDVKVNTWCVPILVVYPFIQKYFVKGVMVGSVKG